jgi:hypothetical protein
MVSSATLAVNPAPIKARMNYNGSSLTIKGGSTMSLTENVIEGTLKSDGTLELDQKPSLSPGRVTVALQPLQAKPAGRRGLADVIDDIRKGQQARGFQGRSSKEIEERLRESELLER